MLFRSVADVVDAAKHLNKNIWTIWSSKKLELIDINSVKHRFFIRVNKDESLDNMKALFGEAIEVVKVVKDEYAFITPMISERVMKDKKKYISGLIGSIRVRF